MNRWQRLPRHHKGSCQVHGKKATHWECVAFVRECSPWNCSPLWHPNKQGHKWCLLALSFHFNRNLLVFSQALWRHLLPSFLSGPLYEVFSVQVHQPLTLVSTFCLLFLAFYFLQAPPARDLIYLGLFWLFFFFSPFSCFHSLSFLYPSLFPLLLASWILPFSPAWKWHRSVYGENKWIYVSFIFKGSLGEFDCSACYLVFI